MCLIFYKLIDEATLRALAASIILSAWMWLGLPWDTVAIEGPIKFGPLLVFVVWAGVKTVIKHEFGTPRRSKEEEGKKKS